MTKADIEFADVVFSYDGVSHVLDGVSFAVERGEFVCVVGENGSGKSTLVRHLNGLLVPERGEVRIAGVPTNDKAGVYAARRHVGMVFQNPDDALVETLVADDVAFGPRNLGLSPEEVRQRVADSLACVGLPGYEDRDTVTLSGGQKQRVAIAGVLAMGPEVLVLDEATAMLDPAGKSEIVAVVRRLHEQGLTVVSVTHDMGEVLQVATRVIALSAGRVAFDGKPADLFANEALVRDLRLEMPYAVRLRNALSDAGVRVDAPMDATPEELAAAIARAARQ